MKRLKQNLPSTTPFINSDFHDILQDQHQLAYSAWLDSINDVQSTTSSADIGIILKGCELVYVEPKVNPTSFNVLFDYKLNFTESDLIYIDGQYYSPSTELLGRIIDVKNSPGFYLKGVTFSDRQTEINEGRIREFRDKTTSTFSVDYRFDLVPLTTNGKFPTASVGVHYVGFQWGGTSRRLKRLLKYNNAAQYDVLMHARPKSWDVVGEDSPYKIFGNVLFRDFDLKGVGRNEMQGFRMYHELSGRFMVGFSASSPTTPVSGQPLQFNYGAVGNTGGANALTFSTTQIPKHDHNGVFLKVGKSEPLGDVDVNLLGELDHSHVIDGRIPYEGLSLLPSNPSKNKKTQQWKSGNFNYGGTLNPAQPYYTNASTPYPEVPDFSAAFRYLQHYALIRKGSSNNTENPFNIYDSQGDDFRNIKKFHRSLLINFGLVNTGLSLGYPDIYQELRSFPVSEALFDAPKRSWPKEGVSNNEQYASIKKEAMWVDMKAHTHLIESAGDNVPHENRPPYFVVIYYTKI
jgi:hypothetical protein